MNSLAIVILCLVASILDSTNGQSGKDIVQKLYEQRDRCREPFGSNWVPLPDGLKCGGTVCEFPKDWCAIRSKGGIPDLFCEPLSSSCQEALKGGKKPEVKLLSKASDEEEEQTTKRPKTTTKAARGDDEEEDNGARSSIPCEDFHDVCCFWAASGECTRNPTWMKRTCRKSCGVCDCSPSNVDLCQPKVKVDQNCRWLFPNAFGNAGPPAPLAPGGADDGKTRLLLPLPPIVGPPLPQAPQAPQAPARPATPVGVPPPPGLSGASGTNNVCQDRQPLCRLWASTGQCERNPRFMLVNCRLSCGLC